MLMIALLPDAKAFERLVQGIFQLAGSFDAAAVSADHRGRLLVLHAF